MSTPSVLLLNHDVTNCGVYQFGRATAEYLAASTAVRFSCREVRDASGWDRARAERPWDLIVVNYHPHTMRWLTRPLVGASACPVVGIAHEFVLSTAFAVDADRFRYRVLHDPTVESRVPGVFVAPRVAPPFEVPPAVEGGPVVVGSFGLGTPGKGFERLVELVQREYAEALVRLHIPPSHFADPTGAQAQALGDRCRRAEPAPPAERVPLPPALPRAPQGAGRPLRARGAAAPGARPALGRVPPGRMSARPRHALQCCAPEAAAAAPAEL